jgi:hypothetical protein
MIAIETSVTSRRRFLAVAAAAAAGWVAARAGGAMPDPSRPTTLFDGKTLDGWIQIENSETSVSSHDITDISAWATAIAAKKNAVAAFLNDGLDDALRGELSGWTAASGSDDKAIRSALAKSLTQTIAGPLIYNKARFHGVRLRAQTKRLLRQNPQGRELVALNRMLLVDAFPGALAPVAPGWTVKDGAMASTGAGRGVIYTAGDYSRFRLMFTMRHVSGNPDHQACVLIFCARPAPHAIPLDALGGIQFQVPRGGHWDYRPGHNDAGNDLFTAVSKVSFDPHQWSRVEIVADASTGRARMAVAQPPGSRAVEVLDFYDPAAGRVGPVAWQMHNAGLFDEYKDVTMEANPENLNLISVG